MRVLGIETSCDESAVCVIDAHGDFGDDFRFAVLGNALISQTEIHAQYGGVFPNLAKREHAKNLVPLLEQTLEQAELPRQGKTLPWVLLERALDEARPHQDKHSDISLYSDKIRDILTREPGLYEKLSVFLQKYTRPEIDAIAVTVGPGLEPALWVGINFARALSAVWQIPLVAVNHMEGHVLVSLMRYEKEYRVSSVAYGGEMHKFEFPLLALLISGGHTELVLSKEWQKYEIMGATRDDAVGEAYDKVARLLGLSYPGGPEISRLAEDARRQKLEADFKLPRPMIHDDNFHFSFAGLKTAVRRLVESKGPTFLRSDLKGVPRSDLDAFKMQVAREFEDAVADVLVAKTIRAVDEYGAETVIVGGGVSANSYIRFRLAEALIKAGSTRLLAPPPELATDNALMIALAGYFSAQNRDFVNPDMLKASGNLKLA
ncbi:MAG: tRNA (adenosine(37)-N6)-threonylcarbamoyltransferase complex transferase subunit TsaD [Patescibacteria group bacterium]